MKSAGDRRVEKAKRIRLLILDCDGVLTDGRILYIGKEQGLHFDVKDGLGLKRWVEAGHVWGLVSGRYAEAAARRAADLGASFTFLQVKDKWEAVAGILNTMEARAEEAAFMGDDVPDLEAMERVGLSAAPADAVYEVRASVDYVTKAKGGRGAVRELIEGILLAQGRWVAGSPREEVGADGRTD